MRERGLGKSVIDEANRIKVIGIDHRNVAYVSKGVDDFVAATWVFVSFSAHFGTMTPLCPIGTH